MESYWDIESLNGNFEDERKFIEESFDNFVLKWKNNKEYLTNSILLKEVLDDLEKLRNIFNRKPNEEYYYWLKQELDNNDKEIRQRAMRIEEFWTKQYNKILFFRIELGKISLEKQQDFLNDKDLEEYKNYLKKIFQNAKYSLSESEEKILLLTDQGSYNMWVKMVESLLLKETRLIKNKNGEIKEQTYPELLSTITSKDKSIRDEAKNAFEDILEKYEDIAEVELNAVLENSKINDELRGFNRPDESRIKEDSIDIEFIDSLIDSVKKSFDISSKYYELLAKIIGQKTIGYHERGVDISEISNRYTYEKTIEILKKVFKNLDKDFLAFFEKALEENRIDSHPKKGKNGGAFCVHFRNIDPHYILLNHTDEFNDVITIAHEMGHLINHTLMKKENSLNYENSKATAEVASTFMEDFVFEEILNNCNVEEKFQLLFERIGRDITTVQRQISFYLFELEIHKKYRERGYLSKENIGEIFTKHMHHYMGKYVDMQGSHLWWIYCSHIREKFYVYSYASGCLISKAMKEEYKKDKLFIKKIKAFLSTGNSKTPREVFEEMGIIIDKDFFDKGISSIRKDLEAVEKIGTELGKF